VGNVIVTGAFGALGEAIVTELADLGHRIAGIDIAAVPDRFDGALAIGQIDLVEEAAVAAAYQQVCDRLGLIDGLVNVAGGFLWERFETGSIESWDMMYQRNLRTAVISSRTALPHLLTTRGSIVNIGAAGAIRPAVGMAPYASSKAGLHAFTESLAEELRGRHVRVNAVLPTIIDTPANRSDMPGVDTTDWVRPQSIAAVIGFLLSPQAGAITGAAIPLSLAG
jgi:NAD(P)-dependent dehydrogenase (short-subunit alcohol dehydrogenase family)